MTLHADNLTPNLFERIRRKLAPLVDKLNISEKLWIPLVCVCLGYKSTRGLGGFVLIGGSDKDGSLYHNGVFFLRLALPFWIGLGVRWRGTGTGKEYWQGGFGWKRNGQFGVNFRVQSDSSAAAGTTGPNFGQAVGWSEGHK